MNDEVPVPVVVPPMFKLDADCFEELFEWLSLKDLFALRQTCKRLQKVVDYFIKSNYPAVKIQYAGFCIFCPTIKNDIHEKSFISKSFSRYDPISIKMIKHLRITTNFLTKQGVDIIKVILPQILQLYVNLNIPTFQGEFYELILQWCPNLKYLSIADIRSNNMIGVDNQWMLRQYPSLEHIKLKNIWTEFSGKVEELKVFFELNPNIQIFSTNKTLLHANANCFLGSNIKIDRLDVDFGDGAEDEDEVCNLLNQLYDQGFYKRVHVSCGLNGFDERTNEQNGSIRGIEKLDIHKLDLVLPPMPSLRELSCWLSIYTTSNFAHRETIAKNLINLERVLLKVAGKKAITPFLRYARNVKQIKVCYTWGEDSENDIIDLVSLNRERSKLAGATKVTIYVPENYFLATKFAVTSTELNLVTLKRAQAVEWTHQFD